MLCRTKEAWPGKAIEAKRESQRSHSTNANGGIQRAAGSWECKMAKRANRFFSSIYYNIYLVSSQSGTLF